MTTKTPSFVVGTSRAPKGSIIKRKVLVNLSDLDALHVIGSPKSGKSTFLGRFADACINAGEGVVLLDPKGDLAQDVALKTSHPDKLIYLSPGADQDRTIAFNIMEIDRNSRYAKKLTNITASNVVTLFAHIGRYDAAVMTLVGKYLYAGAQLVYALPQLTLRDVVLVFLDAGFRNQLRAKSRRPDLQWFWDYFDDWSQRDQRVQVDSTLGRLWDFLTSEDVSLTIASPTSTIHLGDWLDQGKLVVVNLAEGLSNEDGRRIGNLMTSHLTNLYARRESRLSDWSRERRWRLIVDEAHELAPAPFARIIRNGNAFNIFPVFAHQDYGQLQQLDKDSDIPVALGHVSRLAFRQSEGDAPTTSVAYERFRERQESFGEHEADWTYKGLANTPTQRLMMPPWNSTANLTQLVEAQSQAIRYTLPKSDIPSLRERYEAWRQGGTMENNGKPTRQTKATRPNPLHDAPQDLSDEPDSARMGGTGTPGPTRLLDLIDGGEDVFLDGAEHQEPAPPTVNRLQRGQRDVPSPIKGSRSGGGGPYRGVPNSPEVDPPRAEPADSPRRRTPQTP
jgi:hypothetical protein